MLDGGLLLLDQRGLLAERAPLLLVLVHEHRREEVVADRVGLPGLVVGDEPRLHLRDLLGDQPVLEQVLAPRDLLAVLEGHRPQLRQHEARVLHVAHRLLEADGGCRRSELP